jgi:hypothetical protein
MRGQYDCTATIYCLVSCTHCENGAVLLTEKTFLCDDLQAYAMSVLMVITYVFKRKMRAMYEPVAETLPLEIATALDLDRHWEVRLKNVTQRSL